MFFPYYSDADKFYKQYGSVRKGRAVRGEFYHNLDRARENFEALSSGDGINVFKEWWLGVDDDEVKEAGLVPLHYVSTGQQVRDLVAQGADVSARDRYGRSPLHYAVNEEVSKALREAGANVDARDNEGATPIMILPNSRISVIRDLIGGGANVNARDTNDSTALHYNKDHIVIRVLVEAGANVDARDKYESTPLHGKQNADAARVLVEAGANVRARNRHGEVPLHMVGNNVALAKVLVEAGAGADIDLRSGSSDYHVNEITPLQSSGEDVYRYLSWARDNPQSSPSKEENPENCVYTYTSGPDQPIIIPSGCGDKKICVAKISCKFNKKPPITRTYQAYCSTNRNGECPSADVCAANIVAANLSGSEAGESSAVRPVQKTQPAGAVQ